MSELIRLVSDLIRQCAQAPCLPDCLAHRHLETKGNIMDVITVAAPILGLATGVFFTVWMLIRRDARRRERT